MGLARIELVIANDIRIRPMALAKFDELTDEPAITAIRAMTRELVEHAVCFAVISAARSPGTGAWRIMPRRVAPRIAVAAMGFDCGARNDPRVASTFEENDAPP